jgi:Fe-S-cluster-containing dehydrogenase component
MDRSRRDFLKIGGFTALGAAWGVPVVRAVAQAFRAEPAPGALTARRLAMVVDLEKCKNPEVSRAAVAACHRAHNVPTVTDPEEEIKWIWTEEYQVAFPDEVHQYSEPRLLKEPVLVLCNHCDRPPCVRVCPTQATWKRADGVVMMDMHRCIGCRYCMAACPYGSRSFNFRDPWPDKTAANPDYPARTKGVVEKCNFCAERLARGEIPACVEAVSRVAGGEGALVFGDLGDPDSEAARLLRTRHTLRRKTHLGTGPQVYYLV